MGALVEQWRKPIDTLSKAGRAFDVRPPLACGELACGSPTGAVPATLLARCRPRAAAEALGGLGGGAGAARAAPCATRGPPAAAAAGRPAERCLAPAAQPFV